MAFPYPVFTLEPDFSSAPQYGVTSTPQRLDIAAAPARVAFPFIQEDHVFGFDFTFGTLAEIRTLKAFFADRGGRAHPFYLPSWRKDLPVISGTAGSYLLTVAATGYAAAHLSTTRPDHYGRQLFIWQPGQDLYTSRIVSAADGGTGETVLDMEILLPFTLVPETAICGFLYLARFLEDRIDYDHILPDAVKTDLKFRGIRQHILTEQTNPIAGLDYYGSLGFETVTQAPIETQPSDNRSAYAAGPDNLGYTQDLPYSRRWAVWTYLGTVRLKRLATGEISFPDATGVSSSLFLGVTVITEHITLAFDQNAREIIAWQKTAGTIELRQFFSGATTVRTWDGIDPTLAFNQLLDPNLSDGDSDVVCYYLKPGENTLFIRIQRENFLTEHIAAALPLRPLKLRRNYFGSRIHYLELLDVGFRSAILTSTIYPVPPPPPPPPPQVTLEAGKETGTGSGILQTADYTPSVVYADGLPFASLTHPAFRDSGTGTVSSGAAYAEVTISAPKQTDTGSGSARHTGGAYELLVASLSLTAERGSGSASLTGGVYSLVVVTAGNLTEYGNGTSSHTALYELI